MSGGAEERTPKVRPDSRSKKVIQLEHPWQREVNSFVLPTSNQQLLIQEWNNSDFRH